jgi:hypothetical protein
MLASSRKALHVFQSIKKQVTAAIEFNRLLHQKAGAEKKTVATLQHFRNSERGTVSAIPMFAQSSALYPKMRHITRQNISLPFSVFKALLKTKTIHPLPTPRITPFKPTSPTTPQLSPTPPLVLSLAQAHAPHPPQLTVRSRYQAFPAHLSGQESQRAG